MKKNEVRDSFRLQHDIIFGSGGLLFCIEQNSIRFEKFKTLAVFADNQTFRGEYLGNFEIIDKSVFRLKSLSSLMSLLIFGENANRGKEILMNYKVKGARSDKMEFALICLKQIGFNEKYVSNENIEIDDFVNFLEVEFAKSERK